MGLSQVCWAAMGVEGGNMRAVCTKREGEDDRGES